MFVFGLGTNNDILGKFQYFYLAVRIEAMLNRLLTTKVSSKLLGLFRIAFFTNFLFEAFQVFKFRHLIYDPIPYFVPTDSNIFSLIILWIAALGAIIVGYKTPFFSIVNYFLTCFILWKNPSYEYHMFYSYVGVSFLAMFIPLGKSYSIDNLIEEVKYSTTDRIHSVDETVPEFYYYIILFTGIGLVYLDSIFWKLTSPLWLQGLGTWLPASLPFAVNIDASLLLNNEIIIKYMGYLTTLFELVFIFLFWIKPFRLPFFIIGIGLHLGILILFPIPHFALGVIAIYLLLLPLGLPDKLRLPETLILYQITRKLYAIEKSILPNIKLANFFQNNSFYKTKQLGLRLLFGLIILLQLYCSLKSPLIYQNFTAQNPSLVLHLNRNLMVDHYSAELLGITNHPVFTDRHFDGYNHIIRVSYQAPDSQRITLPIINDNGMPYDYNSGFNWVKWTFRVSSPIMNQYDLQQGIRDFTAYWLYNNDVSGNPDGKHTFIISVKKIASPSGWEKNFLKYQLLEPWRDAGTVEWDNGNYTTRIGNIESM